ncbi:MAG: membrane dipeptidase [Calditrichaeota bacterium]|nr:membrane dipeptidase [Calditrichota bacterium]
MLMKHTCRGTMILVWLLAGRTLVTAQALEGVVLDRTTGEPVDSVQVTIRYQPSGLRDSTQTDAEGRWRYTLTPSQVEGQTGPPGDFSVSPFYPNPFSGSTRLTLSLPDPGPVRVSIYDMLGRLVEERVLTLPSGRNAIAWEAHGSAGVYVLRLQAEGRVITQKVVQLHPGHGRGLVACSAPRGNVPGGFAKLSNNQIVLTFSKFAYVPDTLVLDAPTGAPLITHLETVHAHAVVADLHNDILSKMAEEGPYHLGDLHSYNHTDIPRLLQGGVDLQVFAVWIDPERYPGNPFARAMEYIVLWRQEVASNAIHIGQVTTWTELEEILGSGRIAGMLAVEGGHVIENSLAKLRALYESGVRCLTITWNNSTDWAVSASDPRSSYVGLSPFGKQVISLMDSLGMIIDVSHAGELTVRDILAVSRRPIIASHSGARALRDHVRNLRDEQILAIAASGGVIGVIFYPTFLVRTGQPADVNTVANHIDYIARLAGVDHVALGSDFDGIGRTPQGLEDCSRLPNLTWTLLRRGYTMADLQKILGGNFVRVFRTVCGNAPLSRPN